MFDIKWIRDNAADFDRLMAKRDIAPLAETILAADEKRRQHVVKMNEAQERRNAASKDIGAAKQAGDEDKAQSLMDEVSELKAFLQEAEPEERRLSEELNELLASYPNLLLDDVPQGADEDDNQLKTMQGEKPCFDFTPKEHYELGEALGLMDFETAAKISGARFVILKGQLAALERALSTFMISTHVAEHGYMEVSPPYLVRSASLFGTSQLPKFADDLFNTTEDDKWLIPTSEVPLTNLVREATVDESDLPLRFTALTPCFRSEAGSAGKDTRGMLRQHQFQKVEMVGITTPETSEAEQERMLACAEKVLQDLGLHYRVVVLCSGDTGFGARRTFDIEVWLPGQDAYREISSVSTCGDFQARRMQARLRREDNTLDYVHTLNGSGVAVGRALIAVMENYQEADGSIRIPDVLQPQLGFDRIEAK